MKSTDTDGAKSTYKDRLNRYKNLVKKTKKDHHSKYVDSIQNEEEMNIYAKSVLKHATFAKPLTTSLKDTHSSRPAIPHEPHVWGLVSPQGRVCSTKFWIIAWYPAIDIIINEKRIF